MKLGFIGYGNMAGAIIGGIVKAGLLAPADIWVSEKLPEKTAAAKQAGHTIAADLQNLKNNVNMIFICVKPKDFSELLNDISIQGVTYVSIAAGISIDYMAAALCTEAPIVRVMPNTPMLVGMGTSAVCRNEYVTDEAYTLVKKLLASAGSVYDIPESLFNEVINLNGSSPAYIFLFAKTIAEYADANGIDYATGLNMFCDTLKGSAELLQSSGKTADELIQNVSSPGGTTVAALEAMRANGLVSSLQKGCAACVKRAEELGKA